MGPRGDRGERAHCAGPGSEWVRAVRAARCGAGRRPPQAQVPRVASAAADRRVRPHLPAAGSAACNDAQARPRRRRRALAPARDAGPRAVRAAGVRGSERSLCKLLRLLCAMCACAIYYVYCSLVVAHGGAGRARVGWLGGRPRPRAGSRARLSSRAREFHRAHSPQFKANRSFEANRRRQCHFAERGGLWSPDIRWASG